MAAEIRLFGFQNKAAPACVLSAGEQSELTLLFPSFVRKTETRFLRDIDCSFLRRIPIKLTVLPKSKHLRVALPDTAEPVSCGSGLCFMQLDPQFVPLPTISQRCTLLRFVCSD